MINTDNTDREEMLEVWHVNQNSFFRHISTCQRRKKCPLPSLGVDWYAACPLRQTQVADKIIFTKTFQL